MSLPVRLSVAAAILGLVASASVAHADPVTLDINANMEYGGTLTGTITFTSSDFTTASSWDLVASNDALSGTGSPFLGFTYMSLDTSVLEPSSSLIEFNSLVPGNSSALFLVFTSPLSDAGGVIDTLHSYESEPYAGLRSFTSGTATLPPGVTPEPSSFVLLGIGILGFAGALRRRFVKA